MFSQPTNDDQFSVRVDHNFSDKDTFFARASYANVIARDTDPWTAELGGANFSSANIDNARNYALSETHIFSPTLVANFMFTFNRGIEGVPETPAEYNTTQTCFSLACWGPDTFETKYVTNVFDPKGQRSMDQGPPLLQLWWRISPRAGQRHGSRHNRP
jgi:hypothetical protein